MPLYELFALAKPGLSKAQLGGIIKQVGSLVLSNGGVLTDIKSFGERPLAYEIRKPGAKFSEAAMWQVTFASKADLLPDLDHELRMDERLLRWVFLKRRQLAPLPNPYRVARAAEAVAAPLQQAAAPGAPDQA